MDAPHDLLVFGGTGKTGALLVGKARARGLRVAVMARRDAPGLADTRVRGDAFIAEDCIRAIKATQPRAVVSLLGGRNDKGARVDAAGNINVIEAARVHQPGGRLILLTSMGCGEQYDAMPTQVRQMLGEALRAKTEAEQLLRTSALAWTIVRPGGLTNDEGAGRYALSEGPPPWPAPYIARADVALAVLDVLADPASTGRVYTVVGAA
ncbi:NAD(P)-dependent oxidoreductase [Uliginosibacterium sp. sgz301328]|uniref:NAD(P)-dependent oxidoreductase n=1 Tax=Uliginosibacterium sp. sgz301328 TaxID=3243764 RepID=UPI00359D6694